MKFNGRCPLHSSSASSIVCVMPKQRKLKEELRESGSGEFDTFLTSRKSYKRRDDALFFSCLAFIHLTNFDSPRKPEVFSLVFYCSQLLKLPPSNTQPGEQILNSLCVTLCDYYQTIQGLNIFYPEVQRGSHLLYRNFIFYIQCCIKRQLQGQRQCFQCMMLEYLGITCKKMNLGSNFNLSQIN